MIHALLYGLLWGTLGGIFGIILDVLMTPRNERRDAWWYLGSFEPPVKDERPLVPKLIAKLTRKSGS